MAQSALQQTFPGMCPVEDALTKLAQAGIEERGAIFTKREVVEFILDLVNYTTDRPLHEIRLLEPSFGGGDFLLIVIERLFKAWSKRKGNADPEEMLANAIRAVELHDDTFQATREKVIAMLKAEGLETKPATTLADTWLIKGDFLLTPLPFAFDCVVGNPPYVRQELIPAALIAEYRTRYTTVGKSPNNISPIIKYSLQDGVTALWMGDLETDFMEAIENDVQLPAVDILFAPHHGRDSGKVPKTTLDALDPKVIVIGEAPSAHLNYYQGYNTITQNSAGDIVFECLERKIRIFTGFGA